MNHADLSLRDLAPILAVWDRRHFGRAADSLRIPQPTLSARVRKVERALGIQIFERTGRSFLITPDGERILPLIRDLMVCAERLGEAARSATGPGAARPLRIGVIPTLGPYLMPHLLPTLQRARELVPIEIAEHTTAELVQMLRTGTLDAAFLSLPIGADGIDVLPLFDEPFRVIARIGDPILGAARLSPARLRACDMLLLEEGHCLRDQALSLCEKRGGQSPKLVTTSLETLKYIIPTAQGYSLLPMLASELPRGVRSLVRIRDFDGRPPARRIALAFRRTSPRRADVAALARRVRASLPSGVRAVDAPGDRAGA